jgi:hypothetical protein
MTVNKKRSASVLIEPDHAEHSTKHIKESESSSHVAGLLLFLSKRPSDRERPPRVQIRQRAVNYNNNSGRNFRGLLPPPSLDPFHVSEDEEDETPAPRLMPIDFNVVGHKDYTRSSQQRNHILPPTGRPLAPPPRLPQFATGVIVNHQR